MASILYSQYLSHLEALQRFEKKITTPPFYIMIAIAAFIHLLFIASWSLVEKKNYFLIPISQSQIHLQSGNELSGEVDSVRKAAHEERMEELRRKAREIEAKRKAEEKRKRLAQEKAAELAKERLSRFEKETQIRNRNKPKAELPKLSSYSSPSSMSKEVRDKVKQQLRDTKSSSTRNAFEAPSLSGFWRNKIKPLYSGSQGEKSDSPLTSNNAQHSTATPEEIKRITARYTQQISIWIDKHKEYPPAAKERAMQGRVLLRIRIDRAGNIRKASIERSSGYPVLDNAVLQAARKANPLPAVPSQYPGGHLLAFIVAVDFRYK